MAITEESRHRLYQRLEEVLGPEQATTLMEHLPPAGWADVATKRDLDHLAESLGNSLRAEFQRDLRQQFFAVLAANTTLAAIVFAAARLV